MSRTFEQVASCRPSQKGDSYIYCITPIISNGIAAITSADELLLLDRQNLQGGSPLYFADVPEGVTCMVSPEVEGTIITCAGRDGVVAAFDARSGKKISHFKQDRPITALACSVIDIATGTELANHQAVVSIWDKRQNKQRWQNTENNDDITDLQFHPSNVTRLLSGGVDGLVSIFDTTIADEEDSLLQVVNHGPIHKAGYLSDRVIYALSSDEHLSLHPVSSEDDDADPEPVVFGDLRERLECEYAVGVSPNGLDGYLAVGSHTSEPRIELRSIKDGKLAPKPEIRVIGAHADEIVRSLFADAQTGTIFTAGEDGQVKAFQPASVESKLSADPKTKKESKSTDTRNSTCSSGNSKVLVQDSKTFNVHKDIICAASPFFNKCLSAGLAESSSRIVKLPEDRGTVFEIILDWIYGRFHKRYSKPEAKMKIEVGVLVEAYVLADRLCMEFACNEILDVVKEFMSKYTLDGGMLFVKKLRKWLLIPESPLRQLLVEQLAWETSRDPNFKCNIEPVLRRGGDTAWEVMKIVASRRDIHIEDGKFSNNIGCGIPRRN